VAASDALELLVAGDDGRAIFPTRAALGDSA